MTVLLDAGSGSGRPEDDDGAEWLLLLALAALTLAALVAVRRLSGRGPR